MKQIRKRQRGKAAMKQELDDTFIANPLALKDSEAASTANSSEPITAAGSTNFDSTVRRSEIGNTTLHIARPSARFADADLSEAEIGEGFRRSAMMSRQSLALDGDEALRGARLNPLHALSPQSSELRAKAEARKAEREKRFSTVDSAPTTPMTPPIAAPEEGDANGNGPRPSAFALLDTEVAPALLSANVPASVLEETEAPPAPAPASASDDALAAVPVPVPARVSVPMLEAISVSVPVPVSASASASAASASASEDTEVAPPAPAPEEDDEAPPALAPEEDEHEPAPAPPPSKQAESDSDEDKVRRCYCCLLLLATACLCCWFGLGWIGSGTHSASPCS